MVCGCPRLDFGHFYPRSPCGERRFGRIMNVSSGSDFYPRSPCGERLIFTARQAAVGVFLSTLSLRRATAYQRQKAQNQQISIHALLAESDTLSFNGLLAGYPISIHALLAESDRRVLKCDNRAIISIHALLAESDPVHFQGVLDSVRFLSTLSLRRATKTNTGSNESGEFLSTLSLRRATYHRILLQRSANYFYPRSPCGERP